MPHAQKAGQHSAAVQHTMEDYSIAQAEAVGIRLVLKFDTGAYGSTRCELSSGVPAPTWRC